MNVMILAAGRGERMRPLTDLCPKPLLTINEIPLIDYHLRKLAKAGITNVVINYAWLGEQIVAHCGNGDKWQMSIEYSEESTGALETAGGIIKALPLLTKNQSPLSNDPFLVINADIFTDFDFKQLPTLKDDCLAHLFLVSNPEHNINGDFSMSAVENERSLLTNIDLVRDQQTYTFSGIGLYRPVFFAGNNDNNKQAVMQDKNKQSNIILPLAPMLRAAAQQGKISASVIDNTWTEVGTPERLEQLNKINSREVRSNANLG